MKYVVSSIYISSNRDRGASQCASLLDTNQNKSNLHNIYTCFYTVKCWLHSYVFASHYFVLGESAANTGGRKR